MACGEEPHSKSTWLSPPMPAADVALPLDPAASPVLSTLAVRASMMSGRPTALSGSAGTSGGIVASAAATGGTAAGTAGEVAGAVAFNEVELAARLRSHSCLGWITSGCALAIESTMSAVVAARTFLLALGCVTGTVR